MGIPVPVPGKVFQHPLQACFQHRCNGKAMSSAALRVRALSLFRSDIANEVGNDITLHRPPPPLPRMVMAPTSIAERRKSSSASASSIHKTAWMTSSSVYADIAHRPFTTAYQGIPSDGKCNQQLLAHLIPYRSTLKDGRHVEVDFFRHSPTDIEEDEWFVGMALMNLVIREGLTWPFDAEFTSVDDWRAYFLSHTAFVVRAVDNGMDASRRNSSSPGEVLGCFYIKPNFPGRCSHVCNGGFITAPRFRGLGVGRLMGKVFLRAAKDLGYKSSYFNLVFKSNIGSVKLWESLGFQRVATLEKAARLEGLEVGYLDTAYGYRYDLEMLPKDYLGVNS